MELLERDGDLAALQLALEQAAHRRGAVVLISGEAGIGKSSLVRAWLDDPGADARMLVGWCDDLLTSRTLGPFHDVARATGGALAEAVARADTGGVLDALLEELAHPLRPSAVVLEDVHWADEATLDVFRYVGRRLTRLPALLVATYRDELDLDHPLRRVIGALPTAGVHRIRLRPLSSHAVALLTTETQLDPDDVARVTGGNPFFVTEIAHGAEELPESVSDAVTARVRALPPGARSAVEVLSVLPGGVARELVDDLGLVAVDLGTAEARGVLVVDELTVRFRHELARFAVRAALPAAVRVAHHQRVLDRLLASGANAATILHHAVEAGRGDVIAAEGPRAADEAYRAGAHREAAAHQLNVLRFAHLLEPGVEAAIREQQAWTLYNLHRFEEAVATAEAAVGLRAGLGDPIDHGRALCILGRMHYIANAPEEALAAVEAGATLLARHGADEEQAEALAARAALYALTDRPQALAVAEQAIAAAEPLDRPDLLSLAYNYRGVARSERGLAGGMEDLHTAVGIASAAGHLEAAARAYTNLTHEWILADQPAREVLPLLDEALAFLEDHDFAAHAFDVRARQAHVQFLLGDWDDVDRRLRALRATTDQHGVIDLIARETLVRLAVRRGDDEAPQLLEEAWELAQRSRAGQYLGAIGVCRIEQAWLSGELDDVERLVAAIPLDRVRPRQHAEVLRYAALAGHPARPAPSDPEPWASALRGDWRSAAGAWRRLERPYECAVELLASGEVDAVLEALHLLDRLDAAPAARLARRRLRHLGVTNIPRGPVASTRDHPGGLTARQAEVLALLAEGLTNRQIAERLVVSVRTVDHHVGAVLRKLGTRSRQEAVERARQ